MWARVVEIMLGCWLAISPFIFHHAADATMLWANDLACAFFVVTLATLSFWEPTRKSHFGILAIALWLVGYGYFGAPYPTPAALQNDILVGLLLMMLAIIPSEAFLPPRAWRNYHH